MRHHTALDCLFSRSLLSSALLTLFLIAYQASLAEGRVIATYNIVESNSNNNNNNNNNNSPYNKRSPEEQRPHSPFTKPNSPPSGEFGGTARKHSLFPHINDIVAQRESGVKVVILQQTPHASKVVPVPEPALAPPVYHLAPKDRMVFDEKDSKSTEAQTDVFDFWGDEEQRTLIEPRYPSIDLFDEEVEELLEFGEGSFLRETVRGADRHDEVWMVDEWEEELEGDMDELMDWEDSELGHRHPVMDSIMGSRRLREQGSIRDALLDEDESSPFQRIFSDSWLF